MSFPIETTLPPPGEEKEISSVAADEVQVLQLSFSDAETKDGNPFLRDKAGRERFRIRETAPGVYPFPQGFSSLILENPTDGPKGEPKVYLRAYQSGEPKVEEGGTYAATKEAAIETQDWTLYEGTGSLGTTGLVTVPVIEDLTLAEYRIQFVEIKFINNTGAEQTIEVSPLWKWTNKGVEKAFSRSSVTLLANSFEQTYYARSLPSVGEVEGAWIGSPGQWLIVFREENTTGIDVECTASFVVAEDSKGRVPPPALP